MHSGKWTKKDSRGSREHKTNGRGKGRHGGPPPWTEQPSVGNEGYTANSPRVEPVAGKQRKKKKKEQNKSYKKKVNRRLMASGTSSDGRWWSNNGIKWWNEGRVPRGDFVRDVLCLRSLSCLTPRGKTDASSFPSQPRPLCGSRQIVRQTPPHTATCTSLHSTHPHSFWEGNTVTSLWETFC